MVRPEEVYCIHLLMSSKFLQLSHGFHKIVVTFLVSVSGSQGSGLVLEGRHNADKGWIQELRSRGNALVV